MAPASFQNIGWTVGSHCDAHCGHCYSRPERRLSTRPLERRELEVIIARLEALEVRSVNLGGNEPAFTHGPHLGDSQLPWLLERLAEAGIAVGLTTNGTSFRFLHQQHPDSLQTLNDIDFSLDLPWRESHDRHRGAALFDTVIHGIRRCGELGLPCAITTCATRESFVPTTIGAFLDLCRLLDCELRVNILQPVMPRLLEQVPTPEAFYQGFAQLLSRTRCVTLGDACLAAVVGQPIEGCPCGTSSFRIRGRSPQGRIPISPCVYAADFATGDLLTESPAAIVEHAPFASFAHRRQRISRACREADCPWLERCRGGCAARTWLARGDLEARDPYCPLDFQDRHGAPPPLPSPIAWDEAPGLRVHDGYLCTWIGRVHEDHTPERSRIEDFQRP